MNQIKDKIIELLPNREKVLFYIWDELEGPFDHELDAFLKGKIEEYGSWKEKYRIDNILAFKGWIYRDRKQGHWIYYYKNGKLHKDCYYRNNNYHGACTFWAVDGSREEQQFYKGKLHGKTLIYDSAGLLRRTDEYDMGRRKWDH